MIPGRLQRMADQRIRRFGNGLQVTIRAKSSLKNSATGAAISALTVQGNHSLGATTVNLTAASLAGALPKGAQVTISATVYTLTAQAVAADGVIAVAITPALVGAVSAGTAATVSQTYGDFTFHAFRSEVTGRDAMRGVPDEAKLYRLSAHGQEYVPRKGDLLIDGSATETIVETGRPSPGGDAVYHTVFVGSAA